MPSTSHDAHATGAGSSATQRQNAVDDEPRQLQLPDARMPGPLDLSAVDLYVEQGLIRCEVCLRIKPQHQTGQLAQYRTFGRTAIQSVAWHASSPDQPRGATVWKCVECSLAIDTDHSNWQERITSFGRAKGQIYTSVPNQPAEFFRLIYLQEKKNLAVTLEGNKRRLEKIVCEPESVF